MKKLLPLLLLAFVLTACGVPVEGEGVVATSSAVQIPNLLVLAIDALILVGITLGLQVVFDSFGLDLRGFGAAIAVVVSAFVVAQLQGIIDLVPVQYDQLVSIVLNVLVVILSGLGTIRAFFNPTRAAQLLPHPRR